MKRLMELRRRRMRRMMRRGYPDTFGLDVFKI